jgi:hypothetical protein
MESSAATATAIHQNMAIASHARFIPGFMFAATTTQ